MATQAAIKVTPAQRTALTKLSEGAASNQMRQSTRTALHKMGLMTQGQITDLGLQVIGKTRNP